MDSKERDVELEEMEQELRRSLRPVEVPEGFTLRVMERVRRREQAPVVPLLAARRGHVAFGGTAWLLAAAATLIFAVAGGDLLHVRHQRQAAEAAEAQAQVDLAMQLAGHALLQVQHGLDRSPAGRFTQLVIGR